MYRERERERYIYMFKGLLINMVQHWWPTLFKMSGFLQEFKQK